MFSSKNLKGKNKRKKNIFYQIDLARNYQKIVRNKINMPIILIEFLFSLSSSSSFFF